MNYVDISSLNLDDEVIVTLRMDDVIDQVRSFVSDNALPTNLCDIIFDQIYHINCGTELKGIHPSHLLFDQKIVSEYLKAFDINPFPKVDKIPTHAQMPTHPQIPTHAHMPTYNGIPTHAQMPFNGRM